MSENENINESNENNEPVEQPVEQPAEQPAAEGEKCPGCGEVHETVTPEEALERIGSVEFRVLRDDDEVYINLADMGGVVGAALDLARAHNEGQLPPFLAAILDANMSAMAINIRTVLFNEERYVDPKVPVDTVPQEWLANE